MQATKVFNFQVAAAAAAYRNFSTKGVAKPSSWALINRKIKHNTIVEQCRNPMSKIEWGEEQKHVLCAISEGKSVFITGSAGTGKTLLLEEIIKFLNRLHTPSGVYVTASTGIAACALKGQTLHSFAGIGIFTDDDPQHLLERVLSNKGACKRWRKAEALVIDEISMVSAKLFDNLDYVARGVRGVNETWGGIQLVVSGDFFQLPPVIDKDSKSVKYAFEAECWNSSFGLQVELKRVFRQSDYGLTRLLEGIRRGENDRQDLESLEHLCLGNDEYDPCVVNLFPLNKDVERVNEERLRSLQKDVVVYRAVDSGKGHWKGQLSCGIAPYEISLCEGARVMLVKNLDTENGLVNGATGVVVGFSWSFVKGEDLDGMCSDKVLPVVKFDAGQFMTIKPATWDVMDGLQVVACRKQIPLILAWAMSIHKCQGMTLDRIHTDLSRAFGCGMVYVALSRVRSLEGLHLSAFNRSKIKVDQKVSSFYRSLASEKSTEVMVVDKSKRKVHSKRINGVSRKVSNGRAKYMSWFCQRKMKKEAQYFVVILLIIAMSYYGLV
ncbi:ATP-dependent DNA helicase PIF1-like [Abrus precatorius]|uniref:ATP-dependent DNA helicase n=1 Tax=Abrus precatorius TaxID=3816 RepID=A0A8B8KCI9_ABRPR|nr:ATP-dependent DNA helicase PIF1-like [Abrus precatorius]